MIKLTIGRQKPSNVLSVAVNGGKPKTLASCPVPSCVSGKHCEIVFEDGSGDMIITNCNSQNVTWVNGLPIDKGRITLNDKVELGCNHFPLDWSVVQKEIEEVKKTLPQKIDIRFLKDVWGDYKKQQERMQQSQTFINVARTAIPIITIGGVLAGFVLREKGETGQPPFMMVVYGVAIVILVVLFVKSLWDAHRLPKKREELQQKMIADYCCPKCHYFFGFQPYNVLEHNLDKCPGCQSKLIK